MSTPISETATEPMRSAETPTKVFRLCVEQTRYYYIYVEAESAKQAEEGWEANGKGYEYTSSFNPDWEYGEEHLSDDTEEVTDAAIEIDFERVCQVLDLPYQGDEEEEEEEEDLS
jgi:hypothetical protein